MQINCTSLNVLVLVVVVSDHRSEAYWLVLVVQVLHGRVQTIHVVVVVVLVNVGKVVSFSSSACAFGKPSHHVHVSKRVS